MKYRWWVFIVLAAAFFFAYLHRVSITVIAPELMRTFAADATALGLMSSAYFYAYGGIQLPVGLLSDSLGPRGVVTIFVLIMFVGAILFSFASSLFFATLARAMIGLGAGGVYIPTIKAISNWYGKREFASLNGILFATGNLGAIGATTPFAFMVVRIGWRKSLFIIGLVSLIIAMLSWLIVRDSPEDKNLPALNEPSPENNEDLPETTLSKGLKAIITNKYIWLLSTIIFCAYGSLTTFQGL